jgi:hypothetical protein
MTQFPPELQGSFTIQNFLNNSPESSFGEFSTLAMYAKASVLFERAVYKATQCHPSTVFYSIQFKTNPQGFKKNYRYAAQRGHQIHKFVCSP